MPTLDTLLVFAGAALVLAALPGPGLLYVAGRTLAEGRRVGLASSLGAGLGGLVHVLAGAVGVSALIVASATAFTALKVVGGLYLLHLAWQTWRSAGAAALPDGGGPGVRAGAGRALRQGIVVEATNPKTAAFFLALIPQFVDPSMGGVVLQFVVLGLVSVALNTAMAALVVTLAASLRARVTARPSLLRRLQQGSAAILGSLGVWLLLSRRPS
jgi:threonine/homoserine/homoserine lactone efflux protein